MERRFCERLWNEFSTFRSSDNGFVVYIHKWSKLSGTSHGLASSFYFVSLFPCSHFYPKRKEILFSFLEFLTVKMKDDWETLGN